jgi:DNA gyrase subunit B
MSHIKCLLLTLLYRHFPELINRGFVYTANPPLFQIKKGAKVFGYLTDETARKNWILQRVGESYDIPKGTNVDELDLSIIAECTKGYTLGYLKGLGEMNPEELADTTMDKSKRKLSKIEIGDVEEAFETFRVLMDSKAVSERKDFIIDNALEAHLDL